MWNTSSDVCQQWISEWLDKFDQAWWILKGESFSAGGVFWRLQIFGEIDIGNK